MLSRLVRDDQGQDLIEYVLLGSFIAIAAILGVTALGTNLNTWYSSLGSWATAQSAKVPYTATPPGSRARDGRLQTVRSFFPHNRPSVRRRCVAVILDLCSIGL